MTADHPTREERYAAEIEAHPPGDYTHLFDADPASTPFEQTVRCRCGWRGPGSHAAHVAAALVAADPAPVLSRGVAEAWDEGHRDGCDDHLCEQMGHLARNPYRTDLPADDGADCCRERTTAGDCGCGQSGEGESS